MTSEPRRLLAVAISPLSYLGGAPSSAIEVVHNLNFVRGDGTVWPGQAKLRLSGDRSTLAVSMRDSGIGRRVVEVWKLTDRPSSGRRGEAPPARRSGFIVVILQRLQEVGESASLDLVFDLSQATTMTGCIDVSDLRRLGFNVVGADEARVEGIALAPLVAIQPKPKLLQVPPARPRRQANATGGGRPQGSTGRTKSPTGCFATRSELTARIWALHRQQMFPNLAAIARECQTSPEVIKSVVEKQEGLEGYLQTGCLLG